MAVPPEMYEVVPQEDLSPRPRCLRGVTPSKAGVQEVNPRQHWIPGSALPPVAFAGMTEVSYFIGP